MFLRLISMGTRERMRDRLRRVQAFFLPEPYRTVFPYTMVGLSRLRNLKRLAHKIDELDIEGDIVECGTCNGGSGALLAGVASRSARRRHVWLLDSFQGMPRAGEKDGLAAAFYTGTCRGSAQKVHEVIGRSGVPGEAVTIVQGWFDQTLPALPVKKIALLHVDADWYDSVLAVLEHLYDRVAPGGFVVLDDFGYWEGCRKACRDFLNRRGIEVAVIDVDGIAAYFRKP